MFDFTKQGVVQEWKPTHDIASIRPTPQGMEITINGNDPYTFGPARDYPTDDPLWLNVRLKSDQQGTGQFFYFRTGPTEEDSVHFPARAGVWETVQMPLPALGPGYHLRFDPPGTGGKCIVASISVSRRVSLTEPTWPVPSAPDLSGKTFEIHTGSLSLTHAANQLGGFGLSVNGQKMAVGFTRPQIGYMEGDQPHWLDLSAAATVAAREDHGAILVNAAAKDSDGANWQIQQRFTANHRSGSAMDVETRVTVDRDRSVIFLPMLAILPGVGSFGAEKGQGLFAGLEYLDNEPSSSQADLTVPAYHRQVPDSLKITMPLMVVQAQDHYVGLIWDQKPEFSALYDSPDRIFHSGGHLMGVLYPGSNGHNRAEGSLLPYSGDTLAAGKPLVLHATIIAGAGKSVVPAVQQYAALRGLPPLPHVDLSAYMAAATSGWLDSAVRDGALYRHAIPGSFQPHPTADAALLMLWLSTRIHDPALAHQLQDAAHDAISQVPPADYNFASVSHVTYPVTSLVFGHTAENAAHSLQNSQGLMGQFDPNGDIFYHKSPDRPDLGRTQPSHEANGLTAQVVKTVLENAAVSGDPEAIRNGLRVLRALDKFTNTVPRGAQTWEVPLHTPDILASAYLVRAYTLGYELSGDSHFLDQARYWAWTGVPFVYLVNPTGQPVGPYASIAVLGATQFVAPVWMGLPVQWCGLVYADAIARFARYDPAGPWLQISQGITISGIQQTWPRGSDKLRQGLLPDSFNLKAQLRNDPGINPGTVETNAARIIGGPAIYDFRVFRPSGWMVHAPGTITPHTDRPDRISFTVQGWSPDLYQLLIVGVKAQPHATINGKDQTLTAPNQYSAETGRLILTTSGAAEVEVRTVGR